MAMLALLLALLGDGAQIKPTTNAARVKGQDKQHKAAQADVALIDLLTKQLTIFLILHTVQ